MMLDKVRTEHSFGVVYGFGNSGFTLLEYAKQKTLIAGIYYQGCSRSVDGLVDPTGCVPVVWDQDRILAEHYNGPDLHVCVCRLQLCGAPCV